MPRLRPLRPGALARFSALGEHGAIWVALCAVVAVLRPDRRRRALHAAAVTESVYALNTAVKVVVGRRRPTDARVPTRTNLSFPSAHASTSFASACVYPRALGVPAAPLWALALALSASRLCLRVHFPSDVLAGAVLGAGAGRLVARFL